MLASGNTTLWDLGNIWNTGGLPDMRFFFTQSDGSLVRGNVLYVGAGAGGGAVAVPEPATLWLLSLGVVGMAGWRRSSRRPSAA